MNISPKHIVAVDPGAHGAGLSILKDRRLINAQYVRGAKFNAKKEYQTALQYIDFLGERITEEINHILDSDPWPRLLIVEWPQVYMSRGKNPYKAVGEAASLLWLAALAGAIAAYWTRWSGGSVCSVHPHDWKGNMPTETVLTRRIYEELSREELAVLQEGLDNCPASLQHNIWDAVGIGLDGAGRTLK